MLYRALNIGHVTAFTGSGVSRNYGQSDWSTLTRQIRKAHEAKIGERKGGLYSDSGVADLIRHICGPSTEPPNKGGPIRGDDILLVLDMIEDELALHDIPGGVAELISQTIGEEKEGGTKGKKEKKEKKEKKDDEEGIYDIIVRKLRITQFVTLNYDGVLSAAVEKLIEAATGPFPITLPHDQEYHEHSDRETWLAERGPDSEAAIYSYAGVARSLSMQGRRAEADPFFRRALAGILALGGPDHPRAADLYNDIGANAVDLGRFDEAESYSRRAFAVAMRRQPESHGDVFMARAGLAQVLMRLGRHPREAYALLDRDLRQIIASFEGPYAGLPVAERDYARQNFLFLWQVDAAWRAAHVGQPGEPGR